MINRLIFVNRHLGITGAARAVYFAILTGIARRVGIKTMKRSVHNYKMHLDTGDRGLSRTLFLYGKREIDHYKLLHEILHPGMNILDIGANIGYYAIMEAKVIGDLGSVTAIEPMDTNIELLKRNVELNKLGNISIHHAAVSTSTGTGEMFRSTHSNLHTFHSDGSAASSLDATPIEVPTITLKDAAEKAGGKVDLMRMDVEGHEVEILGQLAELADDNFAPSVIFETHLSRYTSNNDFKPVLSKLFDLGYKVTSASSSGASGTKAVAARGYIPEPEFYSDFGVRNIFRNIGDDDAIDMICEAGGLRTILLERTG